MAKDDRRVVSGVRVRATREGKTVTRKSMIVTDADELEKSGVDLQRMHDEGAITGTWKGVKAKK